MQNFTVLASDKQLTLKTLTLTNLEEVTKFIYAKYLSQNADHTQEEKAHLNSLTSSIMIPVLKSEWSFGIWEVKSLELIGVYLQIDVLDYLKITQIINAQQFSCIFDIAHFQETIQQISADLKKGDLILTLYSVFNSSNYQLLQRKQIALIQLGFYMCKLGGWKNIIYQSFNPYPFLRISAEVIATKQNFQNYEGKSYLMKLNMKEMNFNVSPLQKISAKL